MPKNQRDISPIPISWEPEGGWIILLPSTLPDKTEAGVLLPETFTQKNNAGICVKISDAPADAAYSHLLGRECLFPTNNEYRVRDSETSQLYYVLRADQIIISRVPPRKTEFVRILQPDSQEKVEDVA